MSHSPHSLPPLRFLVLFVVVLLLPTDGTATRRETKNARTEKKPDALVEMVPGSDEKVTGKLAIFKHKDGVLIEGVINKLKPGYHGFHVHEKGLLGNKCMDAGPHFNPEKKVHAGPKDLHRHAGDLGNVYANDKGVAKFTIYDAHISLHPDHKNFIGKRTFIVHDKPDDLGKGGDEESLRTGNAGSRLSCGIVIVLGHSLKHPPPVYRLNSAKSRSSHKDYNFGSGHSGGGGKHDFFDFGDFSFGGDKKFGSSSTRLFRPSRPLTAPEGRPHVIRGSHSNIISNTNPKDGSVPKFGYLKPTKKNQHSKKNIAFGYSNSVNNPNPKEVYGNRKKASTKTGFRPVKPSSIYSTGPNFGYQNKQESGLVHNRRNPTHSSTPVHQTNNKQQVAKFGYLPSSNGPYQEKPKVAKAQSVPNVYKASVGGFVDKSAVIPLRPVAVRSLSPTYNLDNFYLWS